jgi:DNA-binding transcriptional LysR family regulator
VQLFSRNQRGVETTSAGEILLEQAREIKAHSDDLVREMDLLRGMQKGELSVGAGIYPGPMFVDKAIGRLICDHPTTQISISHDHGLDLIPRLLRRELDLAVLFLPPAAANPQLNVTKLKPHPIYYVARAAHPLLASHRRLHLSEVLKYPLMGPPRAPTSLVKRLMAAIPKRSIDIKPELSIFCDSLSLMKPIIAESNTIGLLPFNVVRLELEAGTMAVLPVDDSALQPNFAIARLQHRSLSPLGEKLMKLIIEADNELVQIERQFIHLIGKSTTKRRR